jgi:CRISPR-associated endonuclease/helicase Cas3
VGALAQQPRGQPRTGRPAEVGRFPPLARHAVPPRSRPALASHLALGHPVVAVWPKGRIMLSDAARSLAAKFSRDPTNLDDFHPLACHMADVAAVTHALWMHGLGAQQRRLLCDGLDLAEEQAGRWVAFLAGLHDLGKACPAFALKDKHSPSRLGGLLPLHDPVGAAVPGHGSVSGYAVRRLLRERFAVSSAQAAKLGLILAGHHGVFPLDVEQAHGVRIGETADASPKWDAVRAELFHALAELLDVSSAPGQLVPNPAAMVLAGIISTADWIGSNGGLFCWDPAGANDLPAYYARVRSQANEALERIHWRALPEFGAPRTFGELFPFPPRRLQQEAEQIRQTMDSPGLVIVEAPMGEGKTEAALLLTDTWNSMGFRGAYIALPTQATANQLHERVLRFLEERFADERHAGLDVNLLLVHGGAGLLDDVDYLPTTVEDPDERDGAVAAGEWFLPRKRSLLAPYGVGTVDQSLMAVLQVKHVFVRLFGLAGKAVVVDEVHAYDTYMTGLLERLLEWLAALRSPVVLLSATLPTTRRRALVEAYRRGLDIAPVPAEADAPDTEYPRLTWLEDGRMRSRSFPAGQLSGRSLGIVRVPDSPPEVRKLLDQSLAEGGCAAVVCNTVARAQEMYLELRRTLRKEEVGLFHARFLLKDRQKLESRFLKMFGPPGEHGEAPTRPARYVLVATQVVEQSLDLDFDVMVSDLAPVDLLLQRSGRLQRHDRGPRRHPTALHVRWPEERDGVPQFDRGSAAVYDPHILLRTWHLLRGRDAIAIPEDVQGVIDSVYAEDEALPAGVEGTPAAMWRQTWSEMRQKQEGQHALAVQPLVPRPSFDAEEFMESFGDPLLEDRPDAAKERRARTRIEELPSLDVVWLPSRAAGLVLVHKADRERVRRLLLRSVSLRGYWVSKLVGQEYRPASWAGTPALRHHRLILAKSQSFKVPRGPLLRKDPALGIVIVPGNGAIEEEQDD